MYADIIIDITHEKLDKVFQYRIPSELEGILEVGTEVIVPFGRGNKETGGYVIGFPKLRITMKIRSSSFCAGQKISGRLSQSLWRLLRG